MAKIQPIGGVLFTPFDNIDRSEIWQGGLQQFVENHPEVSPSEADAILNAMDVAPEHFVATPSYDDKMAILSALKGLRDTLSLDDYTELLKGMTELAGWLTTKGFLSDPIQPLQACNCGLPEDDPLTCAPECVPPPSFASPCPESMECAAIPCIPDRNTGTDGRCEGTDPYIGEFSWTAGTTQGMNAWTNPRECDCNDDTDCPGGESCEPGNCRAEGFTNFSGRCTVTE